MACQRRGARKDGCISRLINSRRSIKLSLPFSTVVFILQLLLLSDIELDYEHALGFPFSFWPLSFRVFHRQRVLHNAYICFKRKAGDWPQCNCGRPEEPAFIIFKLLFRILGTYIASIRFSMKEMYERNLITRVSTTRAFSD